MFFVVIGFLLALIAHYKIFRMQMACVKMFDVIDERFKSIQSTDVQISNEIVNDTLQELYKFSPDDLSSLYNKVDVHVTDQQALWKACFSESKEERALHMQYCLVSKPKESLLIRRAIASHVVQKKLKNPVVAAVEPQIVKDPVFKAVVIEDPVVVAKEASPIVTTEVKQSDDAKSIEQGDVPKVAPKKTKKKKEPEIQIE
jgi:hypothetical protein